MTSGPDTGVALREHFLLHSERNTTGVLHLVERCCKRKDLHTSLKRGIWFDVRSLVH